MGWALWLLGIAVFFTGAAVFSFLNVMAYRLVRGTDFIRGRSMCPSCGHTLCALDMIPVFGFLIRGGKCAYCRAPISPRYPLSELLGGALALVCLYYGRNNIPGALVSFAFVSILFPTAAVDADTMEIPNGFPLAVFAVAVLSVFAYEEPSLIARLIGVFSVSLPLFLISLAIPGAFGGGDIKLMAAAGAFLGWKLNLIAFALAVLTGGAYGIYLLASKKAGKGSHFAFGPFLCFGCAVSLFWGEALFGLYWGLFI